MSYKVCTKCHVNQPTENFYKRSDRNCRHTYCKHCLNQITLERQRTLKREAIEYKGGKCLQCSYNSCPAALCFHHRDPSQKEFKIGTRSNKKLNETLKAELDKCDLLCHNCHAEIHFKGVWVHSESN